MVPHADFSSNDSDDGEEGRSEDQVSAASILAFANRQLVDQAREHPWRTLGVAAGVGYVLGAGLPRFMVRFARVMLVRSATEALLTSDLAREVGRRLVQGLESAAKDSEEAFSAPSSSNTSKRRRSQRDRRGSKSSSASETTH